MAKRNKVAPFTGAWIEILGETVKAQEDAVAPFTGAWIEMPFANTGFFSTHVVAPFTGAWIEISIGAELIRPVRRRTLHGCVD